MARKITPQERYQKKVGLISKSYKLNEQIVKEFAETCKKVGVTQAAQITKMMKDFIEENGSVEQAEPQK